MFRVVGQFVGQHALPLSTLCVALSIGASCNSFRGCTEGLDAVSRSIRAAGLTDSLRSETESTLRHGVVVQWSLWPATVQIIPRRPQLAGKACAKCGHHLCESKQKDR
eukprot:5108-Heterococcus_DN1.PRE.2